MFHPKILLYSIDFCGSIRDITLICIFPSVLKILLPVPSSCPFLLCCQAVCIGAWVHGPQTIASMGIPPNTSHPCSLWSGDQGHPQLHSLRPAKDLMRHWLKTIITKKIDFKNNSRCLFFKSIMELKFSPVSSLCQQSNACAADRLYVPKHWEQVRGMQEQWQQHLPQRCEGQPSLHIHLGIPPCHMEGLGERTSICTGQDNHCVHAMAPSNNPVSVWIGYCALSREVWPCRGWELGDGFARSDTDTERVRHTEWDRDKNHVVECRLIKIWVNLSYES